MNIIKASSFIGKKAWDAIDIADIEGASVRLHWTDKPYIWHKNTGDEIFVVLEGIVKMLYKTSGVEHETTLAAGDICFLREGEEHLAKPFNGPARILVIEKKGSIQTEMKNKL